MPDRWSIDMGAEGLAGGNRGTNATQGFALLGRWIPRTYDHHGGADIQTENCINLDSWMRYEINFLRNFNNFLLLYTIRLICIVFDR